jgi:hypothetical protein
MDDDEVLSNEDIHENDIDLDVKRDDQPNDDSDPENYEMCDCVDEHGPTCACDGGRARTFSATIIPYTAVYDTHEQWVKRGYFMPGHVVNARITHVERDTSGVGGLFNPYL